MTTYALMLGALGFMPAMAGSLEDPSVLEDLEVQPLEGTLELSRADLLLGEGPSSIALLRTHRPGWGDVRNLGSQWVSVLDARLAKQPDGSVAFVTPAGEVQRFERDDAGALRAVYGLPQTIVESATGATLDTGTLHFSFDAEGRLERMRTAHSSLRLVRDAAGLVTKLETSLGAVQVLRDARGALVALEAPGKRVDYRRDAAGNLVQVAVAGRQESYAYDAKGRLTQAGRGTIAYDAEGRVVAVEGQGFPKARYERDESGRTVTYTVGETKSVLSISEDGLRQTETTGDSTSAIEFDERGRPVKVVRDGETLALSYDAEGRLVQQGAQRFLYGRGALPTGVIAADGQVTKFSYDEAGRMRSYRVGEQSKQFRYDAEGRLTLVTGEGENVRFAYDGHGLLREVKTPEGATRFSRDKDGQLSMIHGPDGSLTEVRYKDGLEVRVSLDAAGNPLSELRYDALGRLVYEQDRFGKVHELRYDAAGQLSELATPAGTLASFAYDEAGEFAGLTDGNGNPLRVENDGKRVVIEDAAAGTRVIEFDDQGRMVKQTTNGVAQAYTYDAEGRLVTRTTPEGLERFSYDAAGNLSSLHGPQGGLELAWDQGRLVRLEASPLGLAVEHRYDAEGRKVKSILPWGEVNYRYDDAGHLSGVQTADGAWIEFEVDAQGRRVAAHYPGGVDTTFAYSGERLREIVSTKDGAVLAKRSYRYGFDGAIQSVESESGRTSFKRDGAGNLVEVKGPEGTVRYGYDAMGNRTSETRDGETLEASYGAGNRIERKGELSFEHDASGAITKRGEQRYRYTSKGQLAEVTLADGSSVRYGYAPNGTRLWREDAAGKTFYLPGLNGTHGEFNAERELLTGYVLGEGLDEVLAARHGDASFFFHTDLVRSVTALTDAEGQLAASFSYDAFGQALSAEGPAASWNTLRYASRPVDLATGDYDYRARTYAPELGRFTRPDPIAFLGGVNVYAYVANDPTALNDPLGLFPGAGLIGDAVGGIVDLGRDTVGVAVDAGQAVGSAAATAGRAVASATVATGQAIGNATVATGRAIGGAA
ncbi:MAG: RHS repeat protein, partial [Planctomycetes bacterium]|nr:RHS repeat protein [Planctomycetota bacterium]